MKLIKTEKYRYLYDSYSNSIVRIKDISSENLFSDQNDIRDYFVKEGLFSEEYIPSFNVWPMDQIEVDLETKLNHLILNVTNQCNLRCKYCAYSGRYVNQRKHSDSYMTKEIANKAVDFFLSRAVESERVTIGFYGGEPLLNFGLIKSVVEKINLYRTIRDRVNFSLTTNGVLLKLEILDFLKENNFKVSISIDGPEEIHDKWRITKNGHATHESVMKNIEMIAQKYPSFFDKKFGFEATLVPPYEILKVNNFFADQNLMKDHYIRLNFVNNVEEMYVPFDLDKALIKLNMNEGIKKLIDSLVNNSIKEVIGLLRLWFPYIKRIYKREKISKLSLLNINGACEPGVRRLYVNCKGEFFLCEKLDYFVSIGSIYNGFDLNTIQKLVESYVRNVNNICGKCWARYFCNLCFISIADKNGINFEKKSRFCMALKKRLDLVFQLYLTVLERNPDAFDELMKINDFGAT